MLAALVGGCVIQKPAATNQPVNENQAAEADNNQDNSSATVSMPVPATETDLSPQNNSGQQGKAVLSSVDNKTKVVLTISGGPAGVAQPAHIHLNSCANIGSVKYPLNPVVNGQSETILNVSLGEILDQLPLAINVHKSAAQASIYVACGDLKKVQEMQVENQGSNNSGAAVNTNQAVNLNQNQQTPNNNENTNQGQASAEKTFNITARNFFYSTKEIRVKKGDKVKIVLFNQEGFHNWVIDEFQVATQIINANQTATVEFTANKTGIFEYYCSVDSHRQMGMVGKLIVE